MIGKNFRISLVLILCIASALLISGCISPSSDLFKSKKNIPPDPETGIREWMDAMNQKDVHRLYVLAPDAIKSQINERDFVRANEDNNLLKPGVEFTNYDVLNKISDGYNASISAQLTMRRPADDGSVFATSLFYKFALFYEDGEWKIWTVPQ
jgi:hypothetical protein